MEEIFICPFCGRNDFKNKSGLSNHIKRCKQNPDRVDVSDEFRRKMSEATKRQWEDPEERKKLIEAQTIAMNRPEVRRKMSETTKKRFEDPEERRKQSEIIKRYYNETPDAHKKTSEATKIKWQDPEYKQKRSEAQHKPEVKQKMSEAQKIAQNRPEVKQKRSESTKKRYEDPEERRKQSEITKRYYNETPDARKKTSESQKIAQNRPEVKQKIYNTKKQNNSFNTSKIEEQLKEYLTSHNINFKTQYKSEVYPFMCDFYFPDKDLYVEIQGTWTHGDEPFDSNNPEHIELLSVWESKNSKFYDSAIHTWTIRDPKKREIAKINNLNWIEIFSCDLDECIQKISEKITI